MITATAVAGTKLYRWVDENGRVHYTDRPQPQAEEVVIGEPTTFEAPVPATPRRPAVQAEPGEPQATTFSGYNSVGVTLPTPDQVLWNIGAVLTVTLSVQPPLQTGHRIEVTFNGEPVGDWPPGATSHQIQDVFRGTHTIGVSVLDAGGGEVAVGTPVTFHVKQSSALN